MTTVKTIRVRMEWVDQLYDKYKTLTEIAKEMGVDKSTASRWLSGEKEASSRFVGTALLTFPISFDEGFVAVEEVAQRRRARVYVKATGTKAA